MTRLDLAAWTGRPPVGVLLADVDGTLIGLETYEAPPEVVEELERLRAAGVATVAVTSKTAAELAVLVRRLPLLPLAVAEGGAVLADLEAGEAEPVGPGRDRLVAALGAARARGWPVRGFADMSVEEVMARTGLDRDAAERAMTRLASEPFVVGSGPGGRELGRLWEELGREGLAVERGGRFFHLVGQGIHKGTGARRLLARLEPQPPVVGAVGDAPNDLPMVALARHGFVLGGAVPAEALPPRVRRIPVRGPYGFLAAARRLRAALG